ncbi:MAG: nucleoside triphosphate pyrophosphohydrolase [Gemmatimonadaceae bacterium]
MLNSTASNSRPTIEAAFARLAAIVAQLRAPDGCPWDRERTHETLRPHLIEEAYEVLHAIEACDDENLCEELGDLMLQPVLHAQIADEANRFDIVDVLENISDKLVRRHPHIFGDVDVENSAQVLANWDAIKNAEEANKNAVPKLSILDDVPRGLPALSLALEISKTAARAGFEWPDAGGVLDKVREEIVELEAAMQHESRERVGEELGDLLFTLVNVARWQKIDPELALRDMTRRFASRFGAMEKLARERGVELAQLSAEDWDELWNRVKAEDGV